MTKKKKRQNPEAEDLLARPWCYYCERDFDDLKILIAHQKAKHYKCERCGRRLNTAGANVNKGLRVHMEQVHKEQLEAVDNALPGRESIDLEIFGTEGIPENEVNAHNQRILAAVAQREADRRAASGQSGNAPKRPKVDISKDLDPENIKKKLEAHKKAMAAAAAGAGPGGMSPVSAVVGGRSASPGHAGVYEQQQSPAAGFQNPTPPPFQQGAHPIPQAPAYPAAPVYPPQNQGAYPTPYHQPPFQQPPASFGRGAPVPPGPGYNNFQPSGPPHAAHPPFGPSGGPGYNPNPHNQFQPQQGPPPPQQHIPRAPSSLPQPHQIPGLPPRPNAPGLPPRPNFGGAPINNSGFGRGGGGWNQQQQQGQGQMYPHAGGANPGFGGAGGYPPTGPSQQSYNQPSYQQQQQQQQHGNHNYQPHNTNGHVHAYNRGRNPSPEEQKPASETTPSSLPDAPVADKKKDEKEKPKRETKMVYSDNEISPEEKRALLPRYEYHPPKTVEVSN
ncbi:hypothetical protein L873DRAFT_1790980 [Choiromyces venosus 120613-1]|uniref:BED-type domain-containing protein n=1 Tax=Choiromyces venosus 120613-1 TaxID=1336337 RepID=A0A3N4JGU6_9PEZI|nr:hypothetical protein L873DRAFT_1790980 [Choiromyces venosus 120613-1]